MKNNFFYLLLLFTTNFLAAQPPCLPSAGGIPAGDEAPGCQLCGPIYQGSTAGYSPTAPGSDGFPCGTIENNQFISIVVDSTGNLSATILASNCQNGQGVQMIIYDQNFNPVSNCFSSGGTNFPGNILANGLTPGVTYWIMVDGFTGDICDILITTSGGVNNGPPEPSGPMTINPDTSPLCPGAVVCYSINSVERATEYEWIIPGNGIITNGGGPSDLQVCIEYIAPGGGVVRVTPSNPCFPGIPAIEPVVVLPILPTLTPPLSVCINDTLAGTFDTCYQTQLGCDSCVTFTYIPTALIQVELDVDICDSECFEVGDSCYLAAGIHRVLLPGDSTKNHCDSMLTLTINRTLITNRLDTSICPGDFVQIDSFILDTTQSVEFFYPQSARNGCDSLLQLNLTISDLSAPEIICFRDSFTNGIAFEWNESIGASGYEIFVDGNLVAVQNHNSYLHIPPSGVDSVLIEITPFNSKGCSFEIGSIVCTAPTSTSTNKIQRSNNIKIAPNPTSGICQIYSSEKIESIKVFDLSGKLLFKDFDEKIDLSKYESGIYFLKIKTRDGIFVEKVIKL